MHGGSSILFSLLLCMCEEEKEKEERSCAEISQKRTKTSEDIY